MISLLHVFMAILASWRMVELFGQDRITGWVRAKWPTYLWTCSRCLSVWMGGVATVIFVAVPWLNWPLALSWLYLWRIENIIKHPRAKQLIVEVSDKGVISVPRSDFTPDFAYRALQTLLDTATRTEAT